MPVNPVMPDDAGIDSESFEEGQVVVEREESANAEPKQERSRETVTSPTREAAADPGDEDDAADERAAKPAEGEKDEKDDEAEAASEAGKELAKRKRGLEGRKATIQEQINAAVRERGEVTRETARGRQEREALQRDIDHLRETKRRLAAGEDVPETRDARREDHDPRRFDPRRPGGERVDPRDPRPLEADFPDFAAYAEAVGRWGARQEVAKAEAARTRRAEQTDRQRWEGERQTKYMERYAKFRDSNPDFEQEINRDDLVLTAPMVDAIKDSEMGPAMLLHLARNSSDIDRISRLHPVLAYGEMKKIEARLEAANSGSAQAGAGAKHAQEHSKAPRPIKPVETATSRNSEKGDLDIPDENADDDEHFERMNKRDALLAKRGINTRKSYGARL